MCNVTTFNEKSYLTPWKWKKKSILWPNCYLQLFLLNICDAFLNFHLTNLVWHNCPILHDWFIWFYVKQINLNVQQLSKKNLALSSVTGKKNKRKREQSCSTAHKKPPEKKFCKNVAERTCREKLQPSAIYLWPPDKPHLAREKLQPLVIYLWPTNYPWFTREPWTIYLWPLHEPRLAREKLQPFWQPLLANKLLLLTHQSPEPSASPWSSTNGQQISLADSPESPEPPTSPNVNLLTGNGLCSTGPLAIHYWPTNKLTREA